MAGNRHGFTTESGSSGERTCRVHTRVRCWPPMAETRREGMEKTLARLVPAFQTLASVVDRLAPLLVWLAEHLQSALAKLDQWHADVLFKCILGACMLFFGGYFPTLIAAVEAYRICGWKTTKQCLLDLYESYKVAKEASEKDDKLDENKDGRPDVLSLSGKELAARKLKVAMKATDPDKVMSATIGLWAGFSAVAATLRMKFARFITLGGAIGDTVTSFLLPTVGPPAKKIVPMEYHKWVDPGLSVVGHGFAILVSYLVQRIIGTIHSAIRGAEMLCGALVMAAHYRNLHIPEELKVLVVTASTVGLALLGLWMQISSGFSLSFPWNLLLMPLRFLDWLLYIFVSRGV